MYYYDLIIINMINGRYHGYDIFIPLLWWELLAAASLKRVYYLSQIIYVYLNFLFIIPYIIVLTLYI